MSLVEEFCRRSFDAEPLEIMRLTIGTVNETLRVDLSNGSAVIVRIGPSEDGGIENGAAALSLVGTLGDIAPRTLAIERVGDRLITAQTIVAGTPASERVPELDEPGIRQYFRDLGSITRTIHDVRGSSFGRVDAGGIPTWSRAIARQLDERVTGYRKVGIDTSPLDELASALPRFRAQLDAAEPRLLHGDLWSLNILLDERDRISGVVDWDNASWGDPLSDWAIHRIRQRAGTAADAFWETYGELPPNSEARLLYAAALSTSGSRLDIERRGLLIADIPPEHWDLAPLLRDLAPLSSLE